MGNVPSTQQVLLHRNCTEPHAWASLPYSCSQKILVSIHKFSLSIYREWERRERQSKRFFLFWLGWQSKGWIFIVFLFRICCFEVARYCNLQTKAPTCCTFHTDVYVFATQNRFLFSGSILLTSVISFEMSNVAHEEFLMMSCM